ncbi:GMC oxidoreductase [Zasmidium cellare ATCC 36951]|uniref:GMC oxidoreductase n=1 Tax=Zasmidium cellare ATCC 36951 TaxID=1080233 RepID=A0A6A6CCX4_ZASCE|nr:GMC oxidoreductase [Zasmidium cellare ATCC 36951]KAF2165044.1 GMC oxidoreductase [Zasmidium cellare ATCC 36951]
MFMQGYLFLYSLAITPTLAWTQPRFGSVPGNNFGLPQNASYDYVVVGGGTAGLTIAYRLAEDGKNSVAVIEAGGFYEQDNGNTSVVPAYCPRYGATTIESAAQYSLVDWGFVTEAQRGLGGRRLHYGRGKTLGGSSATNAMIYNRGTYGSQQRWAKLVGDDAWTFDNLLPYFSRGITYSPGDPQLRAANASVPPPANPLAFNGSGPLHVSNPNFAQIFASYVDGAMAEAGIPTQQDFSSGHLLGRQYAPLTISYPEEERSSSQASYLRAALQSGWENLVIYPNTLARRIVFNESRAATGVEVEASSYQNTNTYVLNATKEVILSAGAFQSPQLLMVSGIGPREQLEKHDIPVLANRPGVGAGMQDHLDFSPIYEINVENGVGAIADPSANVPLIEEYRVNRTGPLTNAGVDYIGWEKLPQPYRSNLSASAAADLAKFPADWPEVSYLQYCPSFHAAQRTDQGILQQIEYEVTAASLSGTDPSKRFGTILAIPVTPLSRGYVKITSNSTRDLPLVNPNQLSHPTDRELAVQAFKRARSFFHTDAMKPILIGDEYMPGANVTSDDAILAYIMKTAYQNWHASCTCRMGKAEDPMAVVDSHARVLGVRGLRVVDAAAFAVLPPGHPQSTVSPMWIAEQCSKQMMGQERLFVEEDLGRRRIEVPTP